MPDRDLPDTPEGFQLAAGEAADAGDREHALALLQAAAARFPRDPVILTSLATLHREAGRLREAVLQCDAAIAAAPGFAGAWLERAYVFASGGSTDRARECYEQVLRIEPGHGPAHSGLAAIAARAGDAAAVRTNAAVALDADPGDATAALALAAVEIEQGRMDVAISLLEPLVAARAGPDPQRSEAHWLLGEANAALGRAEAAYDHYRRAKAEFATLAAPRFATREPHRALLERVAAAIEDREFFPSPPGEPFPLAAGRHLFLLGYPRSGNTLVENVLASLAGVVALEERPTLRAADQAYLADGDGMRRLANAPPDELAVIREAYWRKVADAGLDVRNRSFVDMDPLKGTRLPVIARLFPEARILLMRRDPRDVVWSCFKTPFALTNAALDFSTLEGAARHYAAMMTLIERAQERLPLAFHEVRYEALVADFDGESRRLCEFAGLEWTEEVRRFDRTARARGVATASASQVRRGLYDGRRQWVPFARWIDPVLPILAPWIERFGYS